MPYFHNKPSQTFTQNKKKKRQKASTAQHEKTNQKTTDKVIFFQKTSLNTMNPGLAFHNAIHPFNGVPDHTGPALTCGVGAVPNPARPQGTSGQQPPAQPCGTSCCSHPPAPPSLGGAEEEAGTCPERTGQRQGRASGAPRASARPATAGRSCHAEPARPPPPGGCR